jgi:MerR family mercuric resistance operon transcriptional regulator
MVKPLQAIAIGELLRQTQCNIDTINYYERIGLLPEPLRTQTRIRHYESEDVVRLRFIRRARQLGFSLDGVRALLKLSETDGDHIRTELRSIVAMHVDDIRARITDLRASITDLQTMERVLSNAIRACECGQQPDCPIMELLSVNGEANGLDPDMRL